MYTVVIQKVYTVVIQKVYIVVIQKVYTVEIQKVNTVEIQKVYTVVIQRLYTQMSFEYQPFIDWYQNWRSIEKIDKMIWFSNFSTKKTEKSFLIHGKMDAGMKRRQFSMFDSVFVFDNIFLFGYLT